MGGEGWDKEEVGLGLVSGLGAGGEVEGWLRGFGSSVRS
jgi:hypothetical protein